MSGAFGLHAARMREQGFRVTPWHRAKRPILDDWPDRDLTDAEIAAYADFSIGLVLINEVALDADIDQKPAGSRAVYDAVVAEVPELRTAPEKIGKAPRWTLLARVEVPQSKRVIKMYDAQGKEHKVELLGKGQQTVVAGIHPDTGQPYRYNGRGNVCELKRDDYPLLTVEQIARAMAAARRAMLAAGLKETKPGTTGGAQAHQSGAGSILKRTGAIPTTQRRRRACGLAGGTALVRLRRPRVVGRGTVRLEVRRPGRPARTSAVLVGEVRQV